MTNNTHTTYDRTQTMVMHTCIHNTRMNMATHSTRANITCSRRNTYVLLCRLFRCEVTVKFDRAELSPATVYHIRRVTHASDGHSAQHPKQHNTVSSILVTTNQRHITCECIFVYHIFDNTLMCLIRCVNVTFMSQSFSFYQRHIFV